jgi:hypothetical protein
VNILTSRDQQGQLVLLTMCLTDLERMGQDVHSQLVFLILVMKVMMERLEYPCLDLEPGDDKDDTLSVMVVYVVVFYSNTLRGTRVSRWTLVVCESTSNEGSATHPLIALLHC